MEFLKKLVPGRGGDKDNGKPAAPDNGGKKPLVPATELAGKPAGPDRGLSPAGEEAKSLRREKVTDAAEAGAKLGGVDAPPSHDYSVSHDNDMLQILSEQAGLKYVHLGDYPKHNLTPDLLRLIPSQIARMYKIFPVERRGDGTLVLAISDPLNVRLVDDVRLFLDRALVRDIEAVVANEEEIVDYINLHYGVGDKTLDQMVGEFENQDTSSGLEQGEGQQDLTDLNKIANESPVIRFCSLLLLQAIKEHASDVHIEPFTSMIRIRYRVDGVLREIPSPPKSWQVGIVSRFKVMSSLDIAEQRRPQDGRVKLTVEGREVDLRISTLPVVHGECIVMRLLDKSMMMLGVHQVGMSQEVLERFTKIIQRPNGIVLVTGPTGCGKTTTLYAAINEINDPTEKIITTEDPVEYQIEGIVQVNINPNVGLTFARCLRAILRQDPDVILVGEIRDVETAQIAIQASLTGHLVFSTLHTNSASLTVTRLIDMGIEPFLITSTLEGIIGQRLARSICDRCKRPYKPTAEELADFGTTPEEVADITFHKGEGCDECGYTGYKGRLGIFELMPITDRIRDLIIEKATTDDIQDASIEDGMRTMRQDGWMKICVGLTTFEEVARHTPRATPEQIRREMEALLRETVGELDPTKREREALQMSEVTSAPQDKPMPQPRGIPDLPDIDGELGMPAYKAGDAQQPE